MFVYIFRHTFITQNSYFEYAKTVLTWGEGFDQLIVKKTDRTTVMNPIPNTMEPANRNLEYKIKTALK